MIWDEHPTFVISIDLEMSWGAVHRGSPHDSKPYERERFVVDRVLEMMRSHDISANVGDRGSSVSRSL